MRKQNLTDVERRRRDKQMLRRHFDQMETMRDELVADVPSTLEALERVRLAIEAVSDVDVDLMKALLRDAARWSARLQEVVEDFYKWTNEGVALLELDERRERRERRELFGSPTES